MSFDRSLIFIHFEWQMSKEGGVKAWHSEHMTQPWWWQRHRVPTKDSYPGASKASEEWALYSALLPPALNIAAHFPQIQLAEESNSKAVILKRLFISAVTFFLCVCMVFVGMHALLYSCGCLRTNNASLCLLRLKWEPPCLVILTLSNNMYVKNKHQILNQVTMFFRSIKR